MTSSRTAAGFVAEQAVRVFSPAMSSRRAMTKITSLGSYLIGLGLFSAVDAERRSELLAQYTAADSRWQANLQQVERARSEAWA